ncbi:MAG: Signal transduction histidine kinase, partial [uncultured Thermomicrobiales bacterium]
VGGARSGRAGAGRDGGAEARGRRGGHGGGDAGARDRDPQRDRGGAEPRARRAGGARSHADAGDRPARAGNRLGLAPRPGDGALLQCRRPQPAALPARAGADDRPPLLVHRRLPGRGALAAEHRCARMQPPASGGAGRADRPDARATLPRQHPPLLRRDAARDHQRHQPLVAAADPRGVAPPLDDRLPGRDRDRPGAAGRGGDATGPRRGTRPAGAGDSRHAGAGADRDRPRPGGRAAPPGARPGAGTRAAGASAGDRAREPGGGAEVGPRSADRAAGRPAAGGGAGGARARLHLRDGGARYRPGGREHCPAAAGRGRALPHRPGGPDERAAARRGDRGGDRVAGGAGGGPADRARRRARLRGAGAVRGALRPARDARARAAPRRVVAGRQPPRPRHDDPRGGAGAGRARGRM